VNAYQYCASSVIAERP